MDSDKIERKARYEQIAHNLEVASHLYKKAADSLQSGDDDHHYYSFVKDANHLIDEAFPERVATPKIVVAKPVGGFDWNLFLKILVPVVLVLVTLLILVFTGTTGDMTKTWNPEEIQKNTAYPKTAP
jgi:hypothetical protein